MPPHQHDFEDDDENNSTITDNVDTDETSLALDHAHILLTSFNTFLTVAIHNILYYRRIYPPATFLSTRAYNLPVHQNRHPKVCAWIRDAVDAVAAQLAAGHVDRVAIVIHSPFTNSPSPPEAKNPSPSSPIPPGTVLERWLISTASFPRWPDITSLLDPTAPLSSTTTQINNPSKSITTFSRILARDSRSEPSRERHLQPDPYNPTLSWPDLDEQLRGCLRRMASTAEAMGPLPVPGCGFTVAVELKDDEEEEEAKAPIGSGQIWIPSEPGLQPRSSRGGSRTRDGEDLGGVKTRAVRKVEAGPLWFECWVEESRAKEELELARREEGAEKKGGG